ncbi:MAG: response regulator transcription factor [Phycisphaerales bacterium]|nr:MAG: response regulator transcription factor [Phycisphaerales bacterium]
MAEAFRRGFHGYVLKQGGFDELIQAIGTVMQGSTYLCPRATQNILDLTIPAPVNLGNVRETTLADRECVILQMLSDGRTSKEIALSLHVSSKTIDACRRQLMRKLGVDSIAGLVKRALALGLTTLST